MHMVRALKVDAHGERPTPRTILLALVLAVAVSFAARAGDAPEASTPTKATGPVSRQNVPPPVAAASGKRDHAADYLNPVINPGGYTSAMICGRCHVDIYNSWKNSLHAFSLSDPVFDAAFMQALRDGGDEARRLCLRCHAPLTLGNGDFDLREGVTREGVSCDFCHTVTAVHLENPSQLFSLEPGIVKRSVLRRAASPAHQVAYSSVHETAEFCGACHNYVAPSGAPIMTTYDEWRRGPYPQEGKPCQHCHMVRGEGRVTSPDLKAGSGGRIHRHDLIHDTDQLRSALTAEVAKVVRTEQEVVVEVVVENVGSGHMIPTGIPSREVVLSVGLEAGKRTVTQERHYRKVLADRTGTVLTRDYEALLRATHVVTDNRIGPRERRRERFIFPARGGDTLKVVATLSYVYSPVILDQREINIELFKAERYVR